MEVAEEVYLGEEVSVVSGPEVHHPEEKLLIQFFSIENNFSIYALSQELFFNSGILMFSILYNI